MRPAIRLSFIPRFLIALAVVGVCFLPVYWHGSALAAGTSGTIHTELSDPASCSATYQHVWITVSEVQAHLGSAGWHDLTPGLSNAPVQVDLLNDPANDCFLAQLGTISGLPAGKYQQIRMILFDPVTHGHGKGKGSGPHTHHKGGPGATPPPDNACATALGPDVFNCIELADGSIVPLSLPSEATTGLKIPSGQIAGGGLVIAAGASADLDIDVDACKSVVQDGNSGMFVLKPTLHAGQIDLSAVIGGSVVVGEVKDGAVVPSGATPTPVANAKVWLEAQLPARNFTIGAPSATAATAQVENVLRATTTDNNGDFEFCPMPAGTYEIVVDADVMPGTSDAANATITTDVVVTASDGPGNIVIPLLDDGASAALLEGVFSTENTAAPPGAGDAVTFASVQAFDGTGGAVQAIIPPLVGTSPAPPPGALPSVSTVSLPGNTNCPDIA